MEKREEREERRQHPRLMINMPLEYRVGGVPKAFGAMAVNGSETGLQMHCLRDIPLGSRLAIAVLFPQEFQLSHFKALAEVLWKDVHWEEDWRGYRYGVRFIDVEKEELRKLKGFLSARPKVPGPGQPSAWSPESLQDFILADGGKA
jgi:hypothetical protein